MQHHSTTTGQQVIGAGSRVNQSLFSPIHANPFVSHRSTYNSGHISASITTKMPADIWASSSPTSPTSPNTTTTGLDTTSLAEQLSLSEESFWRATTASKLSSTSLPRQRKYNAPQENMPHTLHMSRFQRSGEVPEFYLKNKHKNSEPRFAAVRKCYLEPHTNCRGKLGPTHVSTQISLQAIETMNITARRKFGSVNNLLKPGIDLLTTLQGTQLQQEQKQRATDEDVEEQRRHWLNVALAQRHAEFQDTQSLSLKANQTARRGFLSRPTTTTTTTTTTSALPQPHHHHHHHHRPLPPPATRKRPLWRYVDPLRPDDAALHESGKINNLQTVSRIYGDMTTSSRILVDELGRNFGQDAQHTINMNTRASTMTSVFEQNINTDGSETVTSSQMPSRSNSPFLFGTAADAHQNGEGTDPSQPTGGTTITTAAAADTPPYFSHSSIALTHQKYSGGSSSRRNSVVYTGSNKNMNHHNYPTTPFSFSSSKSQNANATTTTTTSTKGRTVTNMNNNTATTTGGIDDGNTATASTLFGYPTDVANISFRARVKTAPKLYTQASLQMLEEIDNHNNNSYNNNHNKYYNNSFRSGGAWNNINTGGQQQEGGVVTYAVMQAQVDPIRVWRAPARPGPDMQRSQLLQAHEGESQWTRVPVGAVNRGPDRITMHGGGGVGYF